MVQEVAPKLRSVAIVEVSSEVPAASEQMAIRYAPMAVNTKTLREALSVTNSLCYRSDQLDEVPPSLIIPAPLDAYLPARTSPTRLRSVSTAMCLMAVGIER